MIAPLINGTPIYLVGAHSTGKTTLARAVRDAFGLPMISEVARGVLAEMESALDSIRSNLDVVDRYQREVFIRQLAAEADIQGSFVSDRSFCNLAYAAHHSTITAELVRDTDFQRYMEGVRKGLVFFVRPHRELLANDGVRTDAVWEEVVRIDGMVKLMLEWFDISYIPVASLSMQERMRHVSRVLEIAGFERLSAEEKAAARVASENGDLRTEAPTVVVRRAKQAAELRRSQAEEHGSAS